MVPQCIVGGNINPREQSHIGLSHDVLAHSLCINDVNQRWHVDVLPPGKHHVCHVHSLHVEG